MEKLSKNLTYWSLATSCIILIGAGHGVGPEALVEYIVMHGIITGSDSFQVCFGLDCSYDNSIAAASIAILLGQCITLIANIFDIVILRVSGILIMLFGFLYLCHNLSKDSISSFSFYTGMPFFILSVIVPILIAIQTYHSRLKIDE
ncbi:MAG: hypothetical protein JKY70_07115 [Mucilaginibacter sp.]|nr:hypothetical protein [Mucilaginibacter sp.]